MELAKATLRKVSDKAVNPPQDTGGKDLIPVQINPATLRLQATASVDAGKGAGRARTQYQGTTSTLTFDLVFDTSDRGTTESPTDVRTLTSQVEQFVWPAGPKAVPPRVEFRYGPLSVVGAMTSFNMDLDLFSANGVPLRAKCAVTIKEQKPAFDLVKEGAGAKDAPGATPPLQPSTAASPGGPAGSAPATDRTGTALGGETASSFANRMGVDPRAWKGLQGVTDPLNLQAGQQINFASTLSVDPGLGVQIGATSAGSLPVGGTAVAGLGTAGGAGAAGTTNDLSATAAAVAPLGLDGRELASVGGLSRALSQAAGARAGAAAAAASNAFSTTVATDAPPMGTPPAGSSVAASPSSASGASGPAARVPGSTLPPTSDQLDPRTVGYGFGVPLRPMIGIVGPTTLGLVHERGRGVSSGGDQPPQSRDSSMPSWLALPVSVTGSGSSTGTSNGCCGTSGCTCDTLAVSGCRGC